MNATRMWLELLCWIHVTCKWFKICLDVDYNVLGFFWIFSHFLVNNPIFEPYRDNFTGSGFYLDVSCSNVSRIFLGFFGGLNTFVVEKTNIVSTRLLLNKNEWKTRNHAINDFYLLKVRRYNTSSFERSFQTQWQI